ELLNLAAKSILGEVGPPRQDVEFIVDGHHAAHDCLDQAVPHDGDIIERLDLALVIWPAIAIRKKSKGRIHQLQHRLHEVWRKRLAQLIHRHGERDRLLEWLLHWSQQARVLMRQFIEFGDLGGIRQREYSV